MAHAAVPGVEQIGEAVIRNAGDWSDHWQADDAREPRIARREPPDGDGAIGTDMKPALGIDRVQTAAHVFQSGAEMRQRVRLKIDVAEVDQAAPRHLNPAHAVASLTGPLWFTPERGRQ
jgi:hypothetical protein